tara:strand:- start:1615 stop:1983 length:369 start_codon:yes stop_codon:yes gene_type:complete
MKRRKKYPHNGIYLYHIKPFSHSISRVPLEPGMRNRYLDKWDRSDSISVSTLNAIRNSERYIKVKEKYYDNNDPRSCDQRIESWKIKQGVKMTYSRCCSAIVYDDTDICSKCLEHCDVYKED